MHGELKGKGAGDRHISGHRKGHSPPPPPHLRNRQDPLFFTDTLRRNLDPFGDYPDADLLRVLEQV